MRSVGVGFARTGKNAAAEIIAAKIIKHAQQMGATHFLMQRLPKVATEMALPSSGGLDWHAAVSS